jgi:hypothetical protein
LNSRWRSIGAAALACVVLAAGSARAQVPDHPPSEDGAADSPFLSDAGLSFGWASLMTSDPRFDSQATIGFDLDAFRYRAGRLRFRAAYEAVLGRERRRYDLNQGTYAFEVSGSIDTGPAGLELLSQHVSRHLVDRDNVPSISWNTVGARARTAWTAADGFSARPPAGRRGTRVDGEIELMRAMQQAYVDYTWIARARVALAHPVSPRTALIATASGEVYGVMRGRFRDERVCGGRVEGGIRVRGGAARLEAFAGYERRVDAYPTDRFRVRWFTAGLRIVTVGRQGAV